MLGPTAIAKQWATCQEDNYRRSVVLRERFQDAVPHVLALWPVLSYAKEYSHAFEEQSGLHYSQAYMKQ